MVAKKIKTNKNTPKTIIVICTEGDADELVFKRLINYYQINGWLTPGDLKYHKACGFPNESEIRSKLIQIQHIYNKKEIYFRTVMCEYDTDVLEKNNYIAPDWRIVEKNLKRDLPIKSFCRIEAKTSIEDWILDDLAGLLQALGLPKNTKPKGKSGQDKVKYLFLKKGLVYDRHKGEFNIKPVIDKLDIAKIREARKKELKEFEMLLGVKIMDKKE